MDRERDVIIIGGGPAGLYAAYRLADEGRDVLLLDRRNSIGEEIICTGIVGQEAFDRFGFSPDSIRATIQHLRLVSPEGSALDYSHPRPLAYAVDRARFDRQICHWAEEAGAEIRMQSTVDGVSVSDRHVSVTFQTPAGEESRRSALLLIATGVRQEILRQTPLQPPGDRLKAVQAHVRLPAGAPTTIYVGQKVAPGGFAWTVPLDNGICRVGLMTTANPGRHLDAFLRSLKLPGGSAQVRAEFKPIAQGVGAQTASSRIMAIGEAAGQVKTTTGGGIYYGLLGAEIAAAVAGRAFQTGDFSAQALLEYDRRWKSLMGRDITLGLWARRWAGSLNNAQIERIVQAVRSDGLFSYARTNGRFDWHRAVLQYFFRMPDVRSVLAADGNTPVG